MTVLIVFIGRLLYCSFFIFMSILLHKQTHTVLIIVVDALRAALLIYAVKCVGKQLLSPSQAFHPFLLFANSRGLISTLSRPASFQSWYRHTNSLLEKSISKAGLAHLIELESFVCHLEKRSQVILGYHR